jgi:hypothetical protein
VIASAPVSAERLAAAARAQTALPGATVSDLRRAWDDRLPDLWGVTVDGGDRRANAFFRVAGGRVAVPAGMAQAARDLSELRPLDGRPWGGGLVYVVMAAGGATPGFPDTWKAQETPLPHGGVRVTVHMPERWVAHAAAGGVGPAPMASSAGGGDTAPAPMATATLDISSAYALAWRYQLGHAEIDGPSGTPAESAPALSDEELVAALDGARARARAPRAMPAVEPRRLDGHPDVVVVELWGLGPVYVGLGGPPAIDWAAPPSALVPMLSAADALPPGIVPDDLLATAQVVDGELTAELPAALVEWAAGGAIQLSPRAPGNGAGDDSGRTGRVRLTLGGASDWRLG